MLLIPGIILIVLGVAGYAGRGLFSADRVAKRTGLFGGFGPGLAITSGFGLILLSVVLAIAGVLILGLGGEEDGASSRPPARIPAAPPTTVSAADTSESQTPVESSPQPSVGGSSSSITELRGPTVQLHVEVPDTTKFPPPANVVDELESPTVVSVRVNGSDPHVSGYVKQCVTLSDEVCGNSAPFQVGDDGRAAFQYLIGDDFLAGIDTQGCRAEAARCTIVIEDTDGQRGAEIETIFHDPVPRPGRVVVEPLTGIRDGDIVEVSVEGFPEGAEMTAVLCAAPETNGTRRCGAPGPEAPLLVGSDGTGSTRLRVAAGPVGSERHPCNRSSTCGVAVISARASSRAPVVEISFAQPPGAAYDATRLLVGLAIAAALAVVALWLIRRGDWNPPVEADGHEIDESTYADLDAEAASSTDDDEPALV